MKLTKKKQTEIFELLETYTRTASFLHHKIIAIVEAEKVRKLYPGRASISRPIPHVRRHGWFCIYVDVFPSTGISVLEASP